MKRAKIIFLVLLVAVRMKAQQEYFILIQAENSQPFYVRMADRAFSSSSGGHIILSQLKDSTYNLFIGFPRNQFPEQHFQVAIAKKDLGFVLKNMGQQGWALFNWQTAALVKAMNDLSSRNSYEGMTKRNDLFAQLMAGVVNDTAVLYTIAMTPPPSNEKAAKKEDSIALARHQANVDGLVARLKTADSAKARTIARNNDTAAIKPKADDLSATHLLTKKSDTTASKITAGDSSAVRSVAKNTDSIARHTDSAHAGIVAKSKDTIMKAADSPVVKNNDAQSGIVKNDTLPAKKNQPVVNTNNSLQWRYANTDVKPSQAKNEIRKLEERNNDGSHDMIFTDRTGDNTDTIRISIPVSKDKKEIDAAEKNTGKQTGAQPLYTDSAKQPGIQTSADSSVAPTNSTDRTTEKPVTLANSDCHNFATDLDVDKLRVKMLGERKLDDKLGAARKIFRTRCFSAKQIRALSELFYTDESRFGFFEAAYPHVSDTENFKPLVRLLSDPSYVRRFKEMVRM